MVHLVKRNKDLKYKEVAGTIPVEYYSTVNEIPDFVVNPII